MKRGRFRKIAGVDTTRETDWLKQGLPKVIVLLEFLFMEAWKRSKTPPNLGRRTFPRAFLGISVIEVCKYSVYVGFKRGIVMASVNCDLSIHLSSFCLFCPFRHEGSIVTIITMLKLVYDFYPIVSLKRRLVDTSQLEEVQPDCLMQQIERTSKFLSHLLPK